jgi:hypothetical protein
MISVKAFYRKRSWPNVRYYAAMFGGTETRKTSISIAGRLGLNQGPPVYEA